VKDFANEKVMERLMVYERRIEHSLYRTMSELHRMKLLRPFDMDDRAGRPAFAATEPSCKTNPIPTAQYDTMLCPSGAKKGWPDDQMWPQRVAQSEQMVDMRPFPGDNAGRSTAGDGQATPIGEEKGLHGLGFDG
jgi:hypothetical protein